MIFNPMFIQTKPVEQDKFFNVAEKEVLYQDPSNESILLDYPKRKVVINLSSNKGISIVRNHFLVVSHQKAYELGAQIFQTLFGVAPEIYKEYLSDSTTDYYVDLISDTSRFVLDADGFRLAAIRKNPGLADDQVPHMVEQFNAPVSLAGRSWLVPDFKDVYRPFIRVSNFLRDNSSLYIELGFYRDRCTNGMLLGMRSKSIFKQSYFVSDFSVIERNAQIFFFNQNKRMLGSIHRLWQLLAMPISKADMHLICFDIYEEEITKRGVEERSILNELVHNLVDAYVKEIGENMNAALNVATDFSKRLETNRFSHNKLQRLAALWMYKTTSKTFQMDRYLKSLEGIQERVMNAKLVKEEEFIDDEL